MSFDLVIFDCDGVLVDSEVISCRAHAEVLTRNGYPITADQVHDRFLGRATRDATREIEAELGRPLPDDFSAQLLQRVLALFADALRPIPHIKTALDGITQRVCVASSGMPAKLAASLDSTGLVARFAPNIFSAAEVGRGKPAPDLFLHAAARMTTEPAHALVVEDSVSGILAARAAGMRVLGFCGGSHCRPGHAATLEKAGATAVFDDMRQLPELVRHHGTAAGA